MPGALLLTILATLVTFRVNNLQTGGASGHCMSDAASSGDNSCLRYRRTGQQIHMERGRDDYRFKPLLRSAQSLFLHSNVTSRRVGLVMQPLAGLDYNTVKCPLGR